MAKFLDESGLQHYHQKLSKRVDEKQDILTGSVGEVAGFNADGELQAQSGFLKNPISEIMLQPKDGFNGNMMSGNRILYWAETQVSDQEGAIPKDIKIRVAYSRGTPRLPTGTPQSDTDCANKKYVDDAILAAIGSAIEEAY